MEMNFNVFMDINIIFSVYDCCLHYFVLFYGLIVTMWMFFFYFLGENGKLKSKGLNNTMLFLFPLWIITEYEFQFVFFPFIVAATVSV